MRRRREEYRGKKEKKKKHGQKKKGTVSVSHIANAHSRLSRFVIREETFPPYTGEIEKRDRGTKKKRGSDPEGTTIC